MADEAKPFRGILADPMTVGELAKTAGLSEAATRQRLATGTPKDTRRANVVELLRTAAAAVVDLGLPMVFPGFDYADGPDAEIPIYDQIRNAAGAIYANKDPDYATPVMAGDVAALIRYVADLLEE